MDLSNLVSHWRLEETGAGGRGDAHGSITLAASTNISNAAGKLDFAVDLPAFGSYLFQNNSTLNLGDVDIEINGWVKFDALVSGRPVVFLGSTAKICYCLFTDGTNFKFSVSSDGVTYATTVTSAIALSTGTWYFFRCWHDAGNDEIGIRINAETIVTAAHAGGIFTVPPAPAASFRVGSRIDTGQLLDGQVDSLSFWNRVLTQAEGEGVYNAGAALDYPWTSVTSGGVPAISLAEALKRPTVTANVLAEIGVGIWCRNWIVDGSLSNTYKVSVRRENARGKIFSLNITSVKWNLTTELSEQASAAAVNGIAGSWYSDGTYLWVRPLTGSIFENTVQAFATFYFSQNGPVLNDIFWEPRLASVPALSQRIEATFGGIGQVGGGSLTLLNHDGYFNQMQDFQWHHGRVILRLGIDLPHGQIMAWEDYQVIATWNIREWRRNETAFTLNLEEPKAKVKSKVPFTFYDRATYPNIEDSIVGKPRPLAYGKIYGISPTLIDPGLKKFEVAGHAIKSFDGVRIRTDREEARTITTAVADWQLYSGTTYRYYLSVEEATNVTFNGTSLTEVNSVEDCVATPGSWTTSENYVYVNPSGGQTISSGTYAIRATKTVTGFTTSNFASVDAANAQFTLGNDWAVGVEVSVDFRGKPNTDGSLMENPIDIIEDLLTTVGETNLDDSSFEIARARFAIGSGESGEEVARQRPSVYVEEAKEVLEVISRINELCRCFLFSDELGQFHVGAFRPRQAEDLPLFTDREIMDFEEVTDSEETLSKSVTSYQEREQDDFSQVDTVEKVEQQYIAGQPQPVIEEQVADFAELEDADNWTRRQLQLRGFPLKTYQLVLPWKAILQKPGDQIQIQSEQRQIDDVFEILEVRRDLGSKMVTLLLGDIRALRDTPGFWVNSTDLLPARFNSLAGYGLGSLVWNSAWDMQIKTWARKNVGYWTDANGFANSNDPDSFLLSVWI